MIISTRNSSLIFENCEETIVPFVKTFEGYKEKRYVCPGGKLTIGYGHVIQPNETFNDPITEEEATDLLIKDLLVSHQQLVRSMEGVDLNPEQYSALLDFVFNLGIGNFNSSTLKKCIVSREFNRVPTELMRWVYSGKTILPGLPSLSLRIPSL